MKSLTCSALVSCLREIQIASNMSSSVVGDTGERSPEIFSNNFWVSFRIFQMHRYDLFEEIFVSNYLLFLLIKNREKKKQDMKRSLQDLEKLNKLVRMLKTCFMRGKYIELIYP